MTVRNHRPPIAPAAGSQTGALLLSLVLALSACGAGSVTVEDASEGSGVESAARTPVEAGALTAVEEGPSHVHLEGARLGPGQLVAMVPRGPWPTGSAQKPAQLLLMIVTTDGDEADAIVIGQRSRHFDLDELEGRLTEAPAMSWSKSVTRVVSVSGTDVRLAARAGDGVAPGDYFFVLGAPTEEADRLGSRIIALAQVREVSSSGSTAHVLHQMADVTPEAIALFAHHATPESEKPEALILFARTEREGASDPLALPPLAAAVFDYQAQFQFSNIRIETLDTFVDPAAWDAAEQAQDLAPDEGFGVMVFGEERDDDFLYNITTYGSSPSLATSVGILPGGLPLPTPEGLEGLSHSLAPSFLATAMTQRGDHAEVIYFLEYCLRTQDIAEPVAFHLREHLALRYESIGRPIEGLWLMNHDIGEARDDDKPYAELNALSIREYLHRSLARYDSELADLDAFLEAAEDVLPDESLLSERLERSRVLGRLERSDEALTLLEDVIQDARGQERLRWEVSGAITRANLLFGQGEIDQAVRLLTDTLPDARVLGESYPRYCHALLAQYLAEQNHRDEAMLNMQAAIALASTDESPYSMASTYELAATLHYTFDNLPDAVVAMRESARLYGEIAQYEDAARALLQAGMLELNAAVQTADPQFLADAYDHLAKASDTYLAVGDGASAAQAFGAMALVNSLLRQGAQAAVHYGRTVELGAANNDPETVAVAYERMAELYLALEQMEHSQRALQSARLWAETFGLAGILEEIQILELSMQNAI